MDKDKIHSLIDDNIKLAMKGSYRKREIFKKALRYMESKHILSIVGVRRCGKSTLMKELVRVALKKTTKNNILYLNLEHPFFNQYKDDVNKLQELYDLFFENINKKKKIYIFFDEIQFFKDWQVFVKSLYEKNEAKIVLTGSNSRLLSSELSTLLSGRTIPLHIYPFSIFEAKVSIDKYLKNGGFPEVVLKQGDKKLLAETYYKNILYQDVIPRFGVQNSLAMENLSYYLLSNIGKEISYNTIKSISKIDDKTAKQYISHLQDANLLYIIKNYNFSLKKLVGNKKKIYVVDPLFASISFKNSPDMGRLFENFIYMSFKIKGFDIFFYQNGGECDFLIKEGINMTHAFQACYKLEDKNKDREINGLKNAMSKFSIKKGYVVVKEQKGNIDVNEERIKIIDVKQFLRKFGTSSEN